VIMRFLILFFVLYGKLTRKFPWISKGILKLCAFLLSFTRLGKNIRKGLLTFGFDDRKLVIRNIYYLLFLLDRFLYGRYDPRFSLSLRDHVEIRGLENLKETLSKGTVLLTLHKGNFPWIIARLAQEMKVNVVLRSFKNHRIEVFIKDALRYAKIKMIEPKGSLFKVREALKRGELVVYLVDQYFFNLSRSERSQTLKEWLSFLQIRLETPIFYGRISENEGKMKMEIFPLKDLSGLSSLMFEDIYKEPHIWLWWYRIGKKDGLSELVDLSIREKAE
jgi:hypothetical protein